MMSFRKNIAVHKSLLKSLANGHVIGEETKRVPRLASALYLVYLFLPSIQTELDNENIDSEVNELQQKRRLLETTERELAALLDVTVRGIQKANMTLEEMGFIAHCRQRGQLQVILHPMFNGAYLHMDIDHLHQFLKIERAGEFRHALRLFAKYDDFAKIREVKGSQMPARLSWKEYKESVPQYLRNRPALERLNQALQQKCLFECEVTRQAEKQEVVFVIGRELQDTKQARNSRKVAYRALVTTTLNDAKHAAIESVIAELNTKSSWGELESEQIAMIHKQIDVEHSAVETTTGHLINLLMHIEESIVVRAIANAYRAAIVERKRINNFAGYVRRLIQAELARPIGHLAA